MDDLAAARMRDVLAALGLDGDPEMAESAERFTAFLRERASRETPPDLSPCATSAPGQRVAVRHVPFHALCAHHLLPFFGTVDVAWRAGALLPGFGAIPRVVGWAATAPTLQERLARDVVELLEDRLAPMGVLVRVRARHLCVEMRGARSPAELVVVDTRGDVDGLEELLREG